MHAGFGWRQALSVLTPRSSQKMAPSAACLEALPAMAHVGPALPSGLHGAGMGKSRSFLAESLSWLKAPHAPSAAAASPLRTSATVSAASSPPPMQLSRSISNKVVQERAPAWESPAWDHKLPEGYQIPPHLRRLPPPGSVEPLPPLVLQGSQRAARKDQGTAASLGAGPLHSTAGAEASGKGSNGQRATVGIVAENGAEAACTGSSKLLNGAKANVGYGSMNGAGAASSKAPRVTPSRAEAAVGLGPSEASVGKQALPLMAPRKRGPRKLKAVQDSPAAVAAVTSRAVNTARAKSTKVTTAGNSKMEEVDKEGSIKPRSGLEKDSPALSGSTGAEGNAVSRAANSAGARVIPDLVVGEIGTAAVDIESSKNGTIQSAKKPRKPRNQRFSEQEGWSSSREGEIRLAAEAGQSIENYESLNMVASGEATPIDLEPTSELSLGPAIGRQAVLHQSTGNSTPSPSASAAFQRGNGIALPSSTVHFNVQGGGGSLAGTPLHFNSLRQAARPPQAARSVEAVQVQAENFAEIGRGSGMLAEAGGVSEVLAETGGGSQVVGETAGEGAFTVVAAKHGDLVLVVNSLEDAERVAKLAQTVYRTRVFACDTEVMSIDVKKESPVGHGLMTCFTWYAGPDVDWGGGCSQVFVDFLQGGEQLLEPFKSFFEDASIKKVWHNYGFDRHILFNHGVDARGLYADTMHMARLYDSARDKKAGAGYSLESLTADAAIMGSQRATGKVGMATLFGRPNIKKDGQEGKLKVLPPIEELQTLPDTRDAFIQYAAHDAKATWQLWSNLQRKLKDTKWRGEGADMQGDLWTCYERYYAPFGELLTDMERAGMRVDTDHLAAMEKVALQEQARAGERFRRWAAKRCPDAVLMNVGSDLQIRQLLFGGTKNCKDPLQELPPSRAFKVPNTDGFVEPGREGKLPRKQRNIELRALKNPPLPVEVWTPSGWPAVSGAVLRSLAGKVAIDWALPEVDEDAQGIFAPSDSDAEDVAGPPAKDDAPQYGSAYAAFGGGVAGRAACHAIAALCEVSAISTLLSGFIQPLQGDQMLTPDSRVHCSLNINTETGRLSARKPNLQNQPALEKDRYKIRKAFVAAPGNTLVVADYGQLELRLLAHLAGCESMRQAFEAGGDFHSRTAVNMYAHVRDAVDRGEVLLEWEGARASAPAPMLKDVYGSERRKAKMLNFSIAYGKTAAGLSKDWNVSLEEAQATVDLWYAARQEVKTWQEAQREEARETGYVRTLLGRRRRLPDINPDSRGKKSHAERSAIYRRKSHAERAAINTPVQGSAADVAMLAMLELSRDARLAELGWRLLLQVHDEMILEGPEESADEALQRVVHAMSHPFNGENILSVDLAVDAKCAHNWYDAK